MLRNKNEIVPDAEELAKAEIERQELISKGDFLGNYVFREIIGH
jgi:hypothetical protein